MGSQPGGGCLVPTAQRGHQAPPPGSEPPPRCLGFPPAKPSTGSGAGKHSSFSMIPDLGGVTYPNPTPPCAWVTLVWVTQPLGTPTPVPSAPPAPIPAPPSHLQLHPHPVPATTSHQPASPAPDQSVPVNGRLLSPVPRCPIPGPQRRRGRCPPRRGGAWGRGALRAAERDRAPGTGHRAGKDEPRDNLGGLLLAPPRLSPPP